MFRTECSKRIEVFQNPYLAITSFPHRLRDPKNTNVVEGMVKALARVVSSIQARYYTLPSHIMLLAIMGGI